MPLLAPLLQAGSRALQQFGQRAATKLASRIGGGRVAQVGGALATVAAGTAIGNRLGGGELEDMGPVKRRRKGLSGRDIQGAQRVAALVSSFGYKPKLPCRRKGRKCR
jgi:hypothetical protein